MTIVQVLDQMDYFRFHFPPPCKYPFPIGVYKYDFVEHHVSVHNKSEPMNYAMYPVDIYPHSLTYIDNSRINDIHICNVEIDSEVYKVYNSIDRSQGRDSDACVLQISPTMKEIYIPEDHEIFVELFFEMRKYNKIDEIYTLNDCFFTNYPRHTY